MKQTNIDANLLCSTISKKRNVFALVQHSNGNTLYFFFINRPMQGVPNENKCTSPTPKIPFYSFDLK